MVNDETHGRLLRDTVCRVRGTVQADILKEDQAQNTCIFSTDFALKMMGNVQTWFTEHDVRNFYSVSISGYHIAEADAVDRLKAAAIAGENVFGALMDAVKVLSLGQVSRALYEVGGQYRRSM